MFLLILSVSFIATLLSSMSGSGSALITVPVWIMLGYPLPVAQAASKFNGALWTPVAARNYLKSRKLDLPLIVGLVTVGLGGAYLGTQVIVAMNDILLKRLIGALILCLVIWTALHKTFALEQTAPSVNKLLTYIFAFPLGFYEAFFGSGNGIFTSVMLAKTRGTDLIMALGYYYIISFFWCLLSAVTLFRMGYGDLNLIIPSSIGGVAGAHCGSLIGRKKGAAFVKLLFVTIGSFLGIKLLVGI